MDLLPGVEGIVDNNNTLSSIRTVNIDDIKLRTILTIEQKAPTLKFSKKIFFFHTFLKFTNLDYSSGTSTSDTPNISSEIDKNPSKNDCIVVDIVNGNRDPILYWFALDKPPGHKNLGSQEKLIIKEYKSNISSNFFSFEDDIK